MNRPPEMHRNGRAKIAIDSNEQLCIRFPPDMIDGVRPALEAIRMPDMSANRLRLGPAWWVRLDTFTDKHGNPSPCYDWGVGVFAAADIPQTELSQGVFEYEFKPVHVPLSDNYAHAEIQVFEDGVRVHGKHFDRDVSQRWRRKLQRRIRIVISPCQQVQEMDDWLGTC